MSFNGGCCSINYYCFVSMDVTSLCTNIPQEESIKTVIVKKSSPKNLSADCRPSVGRLSADSRLTNDRQLVMCR